MKKLALALIGIIISGINVYSQTEEQKTADFESAYAACISLRDAVAANDTTAIKAAAEEMKKNNTTHFNTLLNKDTHPTTSLNGHVVFDYEFADSIAKNREFIERSDEINKISSNRGQTADGSIKTKTCMVKAGKSTKYTFSSKGKQDLAVVAEPGGLLTMKIRVTNSAGLNQRYDDTKNVKKGMPQRKTSFMLPTDRRNIVELEVVNCGKKDTSFVVISN